MNKTLKILLKSKNLGSIKNHMDNKNSFIEFHKDYYKNLIRHNYNIRNVSLYQDFDNNNFISEIDINFSKDNDDIEKLKEEDLFYLFKRKYYNKNLYLKVNYLKKDHSEFDINDDVFLL